MWLGGYNLQMHINSIPNHKNGVSRFIKIFDKDQCQNQNQKKKNTHTHTHKYAHKK